MGDLRWIEIPVKKAKQFLGVQVTLTELQHSNLQQRQSSNLSNLAINFLSFLFKLLWVTYTRYNLDDHESNKPNISAYSSENIRIKR